MTSLPHLQFALNLVVAILLGMCIGFERQWRQRLAGLRTNSLVSAGSCLFVLMSQMIPTGGDQSRIASYVVSGVGFLGAGVILKDGASIRGLNTAATLWCSAAIGSLAGFGYFLESGMGAMAVVAIHLALRPAAEIVNRHTFAVLEQELHYKVRIACKKEVEGNIRFLILQAVGTTTLVLHSLKSTENGDETVEVSSDLYSNSKQDNVLEHVVSKLGLEKGVSAASWSIDRRDDHLA